MTRLQRGAYAVVVAGALVTAATAFVPPESPRLGARDDVYVTIGSMASQLGIKITMGADQEFALGVQFTGSLEDPGKLEHFGVKGMHEGARVLAARIAPDRVLVDADELTPPRRATAKLLLNADGKLEVPPKAVATAR